MHLLVLLLLCGFCTARPFSTLDSLRLDVFDNCFVRLTLGTPPKFYIFYLNFTMSEIQLHSTQILFQSHSVQTLGSGRLTDVFDFSSHHPFVRLPMQLSDSSVSPLVSLFSIHQPVGTLGLGRFSPLWLYWSNYTLSRDSLLLGGYDQFHQRDFEDTPAPIQSGKGLIKFTKFSPIHKFNLTLNLDHFESSVPEWLWTDLNDKNIAKIGDQNASSCYNLYAKAHLIYILEETEFVCPEWQKINFVFYPLKLMNGYEWKTVEKANSNTTVSLGRQFLLDYNVFYDVNADAYWITESGADLHNPNTNAINEIWLLVLAGVWTTLVLELGTDGNPLVERLVEVALLLSEFCVWLINFVGFEWGHFFSGLLERPAHFTRFAFSTLVIAGISLGVVRSCRPLKKHSSSPSETRHSDSLSIIGIVNSSILLLWSCFLPHHHNSTDVIFLLFFSTLLAISNGILFLQSIFREKYKLAVLTGLLTLASYCFLLWVNLIPIYRLLDLSFSRHLVIPGYLALAIVFPTFYLAVQMQLLELETGTIRLMNKEVVVPLRAPTTTSTVNSYFMYSSALSQNPN